MTIYEDLWCSQIPRTSPIESQAACAPLSSLKAKVCPDWRDFNWSLRDIPHVLNKMEVMKWSIYCSWFLFVCFNMFQSIFYIYYIYCIYFYYILQHRWTCNTLAFPQSTQTTPWAVPVSKSASWGVTRGLGSTMNVAPKSDVLPPTKLDISGYSVTMRPTPPLSLLIWDPHSGFGAWRSDTSYGAVANVGRIPIWTLKLKGFLGSANNRSRMESKRSTNVGKTAWFGASGPNWGEEKHKKV